MRSCVAIRRSGLRRICVIFAASLLTLWGIANPLAAQRIQSNPLDEGQIPSLRKTLGMPCSFRAKNSSLRSAIESLTTIYSIQVWIDPNVDLDRSFDFESKGDSLAEVLDELAAASDASIVWLGVLVTIVPSTSSNAIESSYWRLYDTWPKSMSKTREFSWEDATSPKAILTEWGETNRWNIDGLASIDFDLWRGGKLPAGPAAAQLTCLVSGLKLEAEIDADSRTITLKELSAAVPLRLSYAQNRIDKKELETWASRWSPSRWVIRDQKVWVEAFPVAHRHLVASPIRPKPSNATVKDPLSNQRFTFEFEGRLLTVLETLAAQAKLKFSPWPLERSVADSRVSVRFAQASIDSILEELSKQTSCQFKRNALEVQIDPK